MGFNVSWTFGAGGSHSLNKLEKDIIQADATSFKGGAAGKINATYEDALAEIDLSEEDEKALDETKVEVNGEQLNMSQIGDKLATANQALTEATTELTDTQTTLTETTGLRDAAQTSVDTLTSTAQNLESQMSGLPTTMPSDPGHQYETDDEGNPTNVETEASKAAYQEYLQKKADYEKYVELKGQHEEVTGQLEEQNKMLEQLNSQVQDAEGKIEGLQTAQQEAQAEVDALNAAMNQLVGDPLAAENLGELSDMEDSKKATLDSGRNTAIGQANTVAGQIAAQASKNEKEKEQMEEDEKNGFDYKNVDGEILTTEQLKELGIDIDSIDSDDKTLSDKLNEKLQDKLKNYLGDKAIANSFNIDLSDGISASEADMILSLSGTGNAGGKLGATEIENILKELGAELSEDDSAYTTNDGFSIKKNGDSVGTAINNKDNGEDKSETKYWSYETDRDGNIVSSKAIYKDNGKTTAEVENEYDILAGTAKIKKTTYTEDNKSETKEINISDVSEEDKSSYIKIENDKYETLQENFENKEMTSSQKADYETIINSESYTVTDKIAKLEELSKEVAEDTNYELIDGGRTKVVTYDDGSKAEFRKDANGEWEKSTEYAAPKKEVSSELIDGGRTKVVTYDDGSKAEFHRNATGNWNTTPTAEYAGTKTAPDTRKEVGSELIDGGRTKVVTYDDGSKAEFHKDANGNWKDKPTAEYDA